MLVARLCAKALSSSLSRHGLPQAIRSDNGAPFASRTAVPRFESFIGLVGGLGNQSGTRVVLAIPKIMEHTSGCIATSAESWNA